MINQCPILILVRFYDTDLELWQEFTAGDDMGDLGFVDSVENRFVTKGGVQGHHYNNMRTRLDNITFITLKKKQKEKGSFH